MYITPFVKSDFKLRFPLNKIIYGRELMIESWTLCDIFE